MMSVAKRQNAQRGLRCALEKILSFENENKSRFILHFAHLFVSLHSDNGMKI